VEVIPDAGNSGSPSGTGESYKKERRGDRQTGAPKLTLPKVGIPLKIQGLPMSEGIIAAYGSLAISE
jgi:hypothetical protein